MPGSGRNSATIARSELLRPYPQFGSITAVEPQGYSWYHALQVRGEKRFSAGYTVNAAYTWSKSMDATSFLNNTDPTPERVISALDYPHRVVVSGIYELPFGKGRRFLSAGPGIVRLLAGGWQIASVFTLQSGAPLGFGNAIFNGDLKDIRLSSGERSVDQWFNINAGFERTTSKQLASNIRTFPSRFAAVRGDGQNVWDASALKNFAMTERLKLQFRAEAYNALNHPNFTSPNTTPTSSAFGKVTAQNGNPRWWQLSLRLNY